MLKRFLTVSLCLLTLTLCGFAPTGFAQTKKPAMKKTPPGPAPDALELAALLCSRVCHDLISPVGAIVADHLAMPSLTQVIKLDVESPAGGGPPLLRCERQAEYGYDTVEVGLPAVVSVGDAINEPRYPSLKAIMGAKKKPLQTLSVGDLEIDAARVGGDGSAARWSGSKEPPRKPAGTIIEDEDTDATVAQIVAWLDERKLI